MALVPCGEDVKLKNLFSGAAFATLIAFAAAAQEPAASPAPANLEPTRDLTLMVEPSHAQARLREVFEPLAKYLSQSLGQSVQLVTPRNYHFFWRDIRANVPVDLMFAEAAFTDYRAQRYGTLPLVQTEQSSAWSLLISDVVTSAELDGLIGRRIVTMPSPSAGFMLLTELFQNPVSQPEILSAGTSWRDGVEMIFADEAEAAIVPRALRDEYSNLRSIWESPEAPGPALSAAADLSPELRMRITEAMLNIHEDPAANEVLLELGVTRFKPATMGDFDGNDALLRNAYGFQPR